MRIFIKGGVWKNTEDEILKAAVMKYGKNQWSRISSLLVRKSAKQCKARWYEWLDPSIRKVEWSREEEEKLLHLAKLIPTQWRSIAQAMNGRTASQCLEHYEKLLNAAQEKEGEKRDQDPATMPGIADDPRRLRPGEIDPNPETKPARPDPIDMDEDEKEMLQEARARLANTKGKKAKRKAREKQLEEARRLASLQKRRELKAAGINIKHHKKRKGIDYNSEVPFERQAPAGFFEVGHENHSQKPLDFKTLTLQQMDEEADKRRDRLEQEARQRDLQKQKLREKFDVPSAIQQINNLNDPEQIVKRSKLSLPKPQLSESELENIVRMQQLGTATPAMLEQLAANPATQTLLHDYSTPAHTPSGVSAIQTPARTPLGKQQALLNEARNLAILSQGATPLQGDHNVDLKDTQANGARPSQRDDLRTPNPLASPRSMPFSITSPRGPVTPGTPASGAYGRTPVRDAMTINNPDYMAAVAASEAQRVNAIRAALKDGFTKLPKPQFEYGAELPAEDAQFDDDSDSTQMPVKEDAEDAARRKLEERRRREETMLKARSQVLQRDLPRPRMVNKQQPPSTGQPTASQQADELVKAEMQSLLMWDAFQFPVPGGGSRNTSAVSPAKIPKSELDAAADLIEQEMSASTQPNSDVFEKAWLDTIDEFVFVPSQKRYARVSAISRQHHVAAVQQTFELLRTQMVNDTKRAVKLEQKLDKLTDGYKKLATKTLAEIDYLHVQLDQATLELACFSALTEQESISAQRRLAEVTGRVKALRDEEIELQKIYATLRVTLGI
eukprot:c3558_g1_i1.p1 GENE.c3558_g1_i1~~c3558_g1_i1.p1  ORF type:complete len:787 (+),score=191.98 c3558_g1_i1:63-2423(+)